MNSIMERFFRSVRREALDNFLLTGKKSGSEDSDEYIASTIVSDRIKGFSKEFRGLVNRE